MRNRFYLSTIIITIFLFAWAACSSSSTGSEPGDLTGESAEYELSSAGDSSINGTFLLEERIDGYTQVTIELTGLDEEEEYTVMIYSGTILDGGDLLIEFDPVDGSSGESVVVLSADAEGNTVTYEDLLELDAHLVVHPAEDEEEILALVDIGRNALTGESLSFELDEVDESGVTGEISFLERAGGGILAVIEMENGGQAGEYSARLYEEDEEAPGDLLFEFNPFDAETGISKTNVSEFEDGTSIEFEDLEELEATLHVYDDSGTTVISIGEIATESDSE